MKNDSDFVQILLAAVRRGDIDMLKLQAEKHGIIEDTMLSLRLVQESIAARQFSIADWLVKGGVSLNARDDMGCTPLEAAIYRGNVAGVEYLLTQGVAVDQLDREGDSVLHSAIDAEVQSAIYETDEKGYYIPASDEMTRLLIKSGADVNVRNSKGETPLDWTIKHHHRAAEKLLRSLGAQKGSE